MLYLFGITSMLFSTILYVVPVGFCNVCDIISMLFSTILYVVPVWYNIDVV